MNTSHHPSDDLNADERAYVHDLPYGSHQPSDAAIQRYCMFIVSDDSGIQPEIMYRTGHALSTTKHGNE